MAKKRKTVSGGHQFQAAPNDGGDESMDHPGPYPFSTLPEAMLGAASSNKYLIIGGHEQLSSLQINLFKGKNNDKKSSL